MLSSENYAKKCPNNCFGLDYPNTIVKHLSEDFQKNIKSFPVKIFINSQNFCMKKASADLEKKRFSRPLPSARARFDKSKYLVFIRPYGKFVKIFMCGLKRTDKKSQLESNFTFFFELKSDKVKLFGILNRAKETQVIFRPRG